MDRQLLVVPGMIITFAVVRLILVTVGMPRTRAVFFRR
jgi:hypothetical protein